MAAALLNHHTLRLGLDAMICSVGIESHDLAVDPEAVAVMAERDLDIRDHLPRMIDRAIIDQDGADLIVTMTRRQLRVVATLAPDALRRAFTAKELARRLATSTDTPSLDTLNEGRTARDLMGDDGADDIADPYGNGLQLHRECAAALDAAMRTIATDLQLLLERGPSR